MDTRKQKRLMRLHPNYLIILFTFSLTGNIFSQEMKSEVNFDFGVFEFEYRTDTNLQVKELINVSLTMVNFGEILIFHRINQKEKELDLISTINSNFKTREIKSNLDTFQLIYSFIHFNLNDTTKIFSSVPHSDLITFRKKPNYYIYCNFKYIENDWVAKITLNKGAIINISIFRYDREKRKVLDSIGTMALVKKK